jgi:hypothetical protein
MNVWLRDARVVKAEEDAFNAERAERRGEPDRARGLHHSAAEGFIAVALSVPADHPNTRSDLGIAAVASFARSGDVWRAVEVGRRLLVEPDALAAHGRSELERMVLEYGALLMPTRSPPRAALRSAAEMARARRDSLEASLRGLSTRAA